MKQSKLEKISFLAARISNNLYLRSLRDAFILAIPFLVLGGLAIIFNSIIFTPDGFMTHFISNESILKIQEFGTRILNGSMNILSLLIVMLFSYNIAVNKEYDNPHMASIIATASLFMVMPMVLTATGAGDQVMNISGYVSYYYLSATGLFMAMICGFATTTLFIYIEKKQIFQLKMEGNIPPAVKKSFAVMSSVIITLTTMGMAFFLITQITNMEVYDLVDKVLQAPLVGLTTSLPGFMVLTFFTNLLFSLGIHPAGIVNPILEPPLLVAMQQNADAYINGTTVPNIIVLPFRDLYGHIGGTGSTIALIFAIFAVSKRKEHKSFAKITIPTSIFNINEPIIFGFPVVFNPLIMIPFIFAPQINYIIAYVATYFGLVSKLVVYVPWSMPPFINAFVASGGDFRNVVLQIILLAIDIVIWVVFLKIYEKSLNIKEK